MGSLVMDLDHDDEDDDDDSYSNKIIKKTNYLYSEASANLSEIVDNNSLNSFSPSF